MSRTHAPSGWQYRTHDPEGLHEELWGWVSGRDGWDIGANEGQSVDRMKANGFETVLAVEPALESFRILEREWPSGFQGVVLRNEAVGACRGLMDLSVRMTPIRGGQLVAPWVSPSGWYGTELYQRSVRCTTLDELQGEYGQPDFIKIDTEGFEEQILQGGRSVIQVGCSWLIEFHSPALKESCVEMLGRNPAHEIRVLDNPESADGNGWLLVKFDEEA
jgi:FkbM family methyltransferase